MVFICTHAVIFREHLNILARGLHLIKHRGDVFQGAEGRVAVGRGASFSVFRLGQCCFWLFANPAFPSARRPGNFSDTVLNDLKAQNLRGQSGPIPMLNAAMLRLRHDVREFLEPRGAANVFRRRAALTINVAQIFDAGVSILHSLDRDSAPPAITKVIGLAKGRNSTLDECRYADVVRSKVLRS